MIISGYIPVSITHKRAGNIHSGEKGFSLIEVMLVIAIIAIMGVFVAPEISDFRPKMQLKSDARDLYSTFQSAKLAAVRHNFNAIIAFNQTIPGGQNMAAGLFDYVVFLDDGIENYKFDNNETILKEFSHEDYVGFDTTKGADLDGIEGLNEVNGIKILAFQPSGIPRDKDNEVWGGTVNLVAKKEGNVKGTAAVSVTQSGNISIDIVYP